MKTLNQILTAISLMTIITTASMANDFKTLRMPVSGGKILEIVVKIENTVEETIPGDLNVLNEKRKTASEKTLELPVYVEREVEEDYMTVNTKDESCEFISLCLLLAEIHKPEVEVEETDIDTRAIFEKIMKENSYKLTEEALSKVVKPESEVNEEEPYRVFTASYISK
jgi:hypothetical protein